MKILCSLLIISGVTLANIVVQPHQSVTAKVGGSVTLECFINPSHRYNFIWLKQEFGQSPRYVASSFGFLDEALFHNEFLQSSRHHIVKNNTTFNLIIAHLELSDMGIYSCGVVKHGNVIFGNGTELCFTDSVLRREIHQPPVLKPIQDGDNITLECVLKNVGLKERYNVYWFHHTLGGSHQGIIIPKEKSLIKCDTSSQECISSLHKLNYSSEDAGTYYCTLVQCGEILLGNGTKLTGNDYRLRMNPAVLILGLINAILVVSLVCLAVKKGCSCEYSKRKDDLNVSSCHQSSNEVSDNPQCQEVNYSVLDFGQSKRKPRRMMNKDDTSTTYTCVRYLPEE